VTHFGGLVSLIEFFNVLKLGEVLGCLMPLAYTSPNAILPEQTLLAFVISIIAGARRLAHTDSRAERDSLPQAAYGWLAVSLRSAARCSKRSGHQEGAERGYNPSRPGRHTHHPLLAVLAEAPMILHGWLRSGKAGSARGVVPFLQEALALMPTDWRLRTVRADSGFFDQALLGFLEVRACPTSSWRA